jgi:hypothetical protein
MNLSISFSNACRKSYKEIKRIYERMSLSLSAVSISFALCIFSLKTQNKKMMMIKNLRKKISESFVCVMIVGIHVDIR